MTDRLRVLYIMGWGRSGSTIVDNLLGELDGFFSAGEVVYLWERGVLEARRCGCGRPLRQCEVWGPVLEKVLEGCGSAEARAHEIVGWQQQVARVRHTWRLLRESSGRAAVREPLDAYIKVSQRLYTALAEVTGARVIVDSSKRPSDAALLRLLPQVRASFVHLVRDPRAVAYSWSRRKVQLDRDRPAELVKHGSMNSTLNWLIWNLGSEALRRRHPAEASMLVRYEDFVDDPHRTLRAIAALVGESVDRLPLDGARTALLRTNHTASGNPSRFTTGPVVLREDTEWVTAQRVPDRLLSTALALPLLYRYGYRLRP